MNETNFGKIPRQCLLKIKAMYDNLKKAEKKAVDCILDDSEAIKDLTVIDFAGKAGCSEATIVRLSKKLGYTGFPHLKADFASGEIGGNEEFGYKGISGSDSYIKVMEKVVEATIEALRDTPKIIEKSEYERAINALLTAPKILFCGLGDGALVAMEAYQRFLRIGINCAVSEDADLQLILSAHLKKGDVLVAISHSGKSKTVVNTVKRAKESGATVIAITNFPVSPLTKKADIILLTAVFTQHITGEVISKRVAELCIIESLYINYIIKKGKPVLNCLKESDKAIRINKLQ